MALRPKYQLNHMALQGARTTIPARSFTQLTTRRYPYPRVGTRAPNGMFPKTGNPLEITQEKVHYELGNGNPVNVWRPHYTLDKAAIQGVMPASTYRRLTGKLTTEPQIPTYIGDHSLAMHEPPTVASYGAEYAIPRAPALAFDWGTFFWGAVAGGVVALAMVYGIIPALGEWGAVAIRARY